MIRKFEFAKKILLLFCMHSLWLKYIGYGENILMILAWHLASAIPATGNHRYEDKTKIDAGI